MSPQVLSQNTPPPSYDPSTDSTPRCSSFEHFAPGLQFLSNDPTSEGKRHDLRQQQQQQKQQTKLHQDAVPQGETAKLRDPHPNDSAYVDLLYIVNPAGETTVMDLTSPEPASASSSSAVPSVSAAPGPPIQYALPAEHDDTSVPAFLPPLSAPFNPPATTTTIIAGSGSARALLGPELELEEANELDYEARLMRWWPGPEADEIKVERM